MLTVRSFREKDLSQVLSLCREVRDYHIELCSFGIKNVIISEKN